MCGRDGLCVWDCIGNSGSFTSVIVNPELRGSELETGPYSLAPRL